MYLPKVEGKKVKGKSKSINWTLAGISGGGWFIKCPKAYGFRYSGGI